MPKNAMTTSPSLQIRHQAVRGRLRVDVGAIRHDPSLAARLAGSLTRQPAVREVKANHWSGSLLVRYDPAVATKTILDLIEACLLGQPHPRSGAASGRRDNGRPLPEEEPHSKETPGVQNTGTAWHVLSKAEALQRFGQTGREGLSPDQVRRSLEKYGPNALIRRSPESSWRILVRQFVNLPTALLLGSVVISVATGGLVDAVAVVAVVTANASIGFFMERSAKRTIESLSATEEPPASVIRGGEPTVIPAEEVVPGDLIVLGPGALVSADGRLIEANDLTIDESSLTGESLAVPKSTQAMERADMPLADRHNLVFRGTSVTGGDGVALAYATGHETEIGRIFSLTSSAAPPEAPMQVQLERMTRRLVMGSLVLCGGVMVLGLLRGQPLLQVIKGAASLAVAAMPEGLPTTAVVSLALGVRKMRRQEALVRQLGTVENLGAIQVLCMDKTGTITTNRMTFAGFALGTEDYDTSSPKPCNERPEEEQERLRKLFRVCVLCSDATLEHGQDGSIRVDGSSTEAALVQSALDAGIDAEALRADFPLQTMMRRTETRKYMLSEHSADSGRLRIAAKGSPEQLLELCTSSWHQKTPSR